MEMVAHLCIFTHTTTNTFRLFVAPIKAYFPYICFDFNLNLYRARTLYVLVHQRIFHPKYEWCTAAHILSNVERLRRDTQK